MEHDRHTSEIDLALTFVNGGSLPDSDDGVTLDSADRLTGWLALLLAPGGARLRVSPPVRRSLLAEAQRLQRALRELFQAVSTGESVPPMAIHVINRAQSFGSWSTRLAADGATIRMERTLTGPGALPALASVAAAAGVVATRVPAERLRRCASPDCARWFVDSSKGGRRRWCSMATCGNRAKAARYRARHAES